MLNISYLTYILNDCVSSTWGGSLTQNKIFKITIYFHYFVYYIFKGSKQWKAHQASLQTGWQEV